MKHKHLLMLLIIFVLSLSALFAQPEAASSADNPDYASMAKIIFNKVFDLDFTVAKDIDWSVLILDGDSLFIEYVALSTEPEKQEFQTNAIQKLSDWFQIDESYGDYYEWSFQQDKSSYYMYGATDFFDVLLMFKIKDEMLQLIDVSFVDY